MSDKELINIEVAYAEPQKQKIVELKLPAGTTARQAVEQSKLDEIFPKLDLQNSDLGLFGQSLGTKGLAKAEEYEVQDGDRIEIYRPLISDPKEVRRRRAAKAKEAKE